MSKSNTSLHTETLPAADVDGERVKLIAEHTHRGTLYAVGDVITVRGKQAERLIVANRAVKA